MKITPLLDALLEKINEGFHQFLLASVCQQLGWSRIDIIEDGTLVQMPVGVNIHTEPIPIRELKQYRKRMPNFILEFFHSKFVQLWQQLLTDLFGHIVDMHLKKQQLFPELKIQPAKLNFASTEDITIQLKQSLRKDFAFRKYADRIKLISKIINKIDIQCKDFRIIYKHILIRNSFEHRNGKVDFYMLKELGDNKITILNSNGKPQILKDGDYINLTIPEFDQFYRSLLFILQHWRN